MTIAVGLITRTSLAMADLVLDDTVYQIRRGFDVGSLTWRRDTIPGGLAGGTFEIGSVRDQSQGTLPLFVKGANENAIRDNVDALIDAVSQFSYQLQLTIRGTAYRWVCNRADVKVDFGDEHLYAGRAPVTLSYPRDPIPVTGPI